MYTVFVLILQNITRGKVPHDITRVPTVCSPSVPFNPFMIRKLAIFQNQLIRYNKLINPFDKSSLLFVFLMRMTKGCVVRRAKSSARKSKFRKMKISKIRLIVRVSP